MAFDLDNEELKATRKLHNQDDGLYEETSDKNVANDRVIAHKFAIMQQQLEQKDKRVQELEKENAMLKLIRVEYEYGYENIHLCTKNDLVRIDKNKYLIEIKDGKFVDIKQLYIDSLDSIPKQKIKDKIGVLKMEEKYDYLDNKKAIQTLEELLEDK